VPLVLFVVSPELSNVKRNGTIMKTPLIPVVKSCDEDETKAFRYKIVVSYDGTDYAGWQVQPNGVTVQEKIESAIFQLAGEHVKVHGSGRTDQGVHARGQVAHFDLCRELPLKAIERGLNSLLPVDIRIMKAQRVAPDFHARKSAKGKEYRYFIWNGRTMPPYLRNYRAHVKSKLDLGAMREAAKLLAGAHDFTAFSANPGRIIESNVRQVTSVKISKAGHDIVISAKGEGFLYKMVRSLAGFLIRVGEGAIPASEVPAIIASKTRTARVPTAPAQGLFLWNVNY
jgi:tRNA pseudouridine38-40 synthase